MAVWIRQIETQVPETSYPQEYASQKMQEWIGSEREQRLIRALYRKSGIDKRHSVVTDFDSESGDAFFQRDNDGRLVEPGTARRNEIFRTAAGPLVVAAARRAIANCRGIETADITHVITVSCTGFYNPGPDYQLVTELGLPHGTQRYHLGFMGCYAAFPALRMAKQFCLADPNAVVLVVALELCSLHLQLGSGEDSLLANSLFADGAAAALVSARQPATGQPCFKLGNFHSTLIPSGKEDMAWSIGDRGFDIALSSYVPKIIGANVSTILDEIRATEGDLADQNDIWAIHPGGKAIVDKVQQSLDLAPEKVAASRQTLREFGNMSSATVLFVLRRILDQAANERRKVYAMAFGPGLTVEMAILETGADS